jgi:hypothetical protein
MISQFARDMKMLGSDAMTGQPTDNVCYLTTLSILETLSRRQYLSKYSALVE